MPTRDGVVLWLASVVVIAGGRILGLRELYLIGAGGVALPLVAIAYVCCSRVTVAGHRRLVPGRLQAGATCRVEITITNEGVRRNCSLTVDDGNGPCAAVSPLATGETVDVSYLLPTTRRGLVPVGPLRVRVQDPFGLAARTLAILGPTTLTVQPRVDRLVLPAEPSSPAVAGLAHRVGLSPFPTHDFHALKPYEEGDDLRLVHWPTSARLDTLVVRQDEAPQVRQTVVALDLRRSVHDAATTERAVSAAASVAVAAAEEEGLVRLVTTGGLDSSSAGGERHVEELLDILAAVSRDGARDLGQLVRGLDERDGTTIVLITTDGAIAQDLATVGRLHASHPMVLAVLFERDGGKERPATAVRPQFDRTVVVRPMAPFAPAWGRGMSAPLEP